MHDETGVTFVDVGAYDGRSSRAYEKVHPVRHIHMWEPNPMMAMKFPETPYTFHEAAAWTENGHGRLYLSCPNRRYGQGQGSTLYEHKTTGFLDMANPLRVRTVDFASWMYSHCYDALVVKLNVEGAEYDLLTAAEETGAIEIPDEWIISWHGEKVGKGEEDADTHRLALLRAGYVMSRPHTCLPEEFERWTK